MSTSSRPGTTAAPSPSTCASSERAQRELHVGRGQVQPAVLGAQQDPGQDLAPPSASRRRARRSRASATSSSRGAGELHPRTDHCVCTDHLRKPLVVVIESVDDGEDGVRSLGRAALPCGRIRWTNGGFHQPPAPLEGPQKSPACLIRAVSSCTRLYTDRSSRIRRAIFEVAWITVVWSRPPNSLPIFGSDESVSSRERYIATWRG